MFEKLFLLFFLYTQSLANPSCLFLFPEAYRCLLSIYNPFGVNNFTAIEGEHIGGMTNADVRFLEQSMNVLSFTRNIPSIICDTFVNLEQLGLSRVELEVIEYGSFLNCRNLEILTLRNNRISKLSANTFKELPRLDTLILEGNLIADLPAGIFATLPKLAGLMLEFNRIEVIHSNWFREDQRIEAFFMENNNVNAIDERIFDLGIVQLIRMFGNRCSSAIFAQWEDLRVCFDNFVKLS